jgi:hypothetical protein
MSEAGCDKTRGSRKAVRLRWVAALILLGPGAGSWVLYRGVAGSLQAEENLHTTLFTIRLVEEFVALNGRWPHSWDELEKLPVSGDAPSPMSGGRSALRIGGEHGYDWPGASQAIRRRVSIAFGANPRQIARQDPMSFAAIKPIGPYYEYRDYGLVASLEAMIRKGLKLIPAE